MGDRDNRIPKVVRERQIDGYLTDRRLERKGFIGACRKGVIVYYLLLTVDSFVNAVDSF